MTYDQWLEEPYQRQTRPSDGDIAEDHGLHETVAPCSRCGLPCAVVEHVVEVWSSSWDDETGKGGMHRVEDAQRDDERTTVANPDAKPEDYVCHVCAGNCTEDQIVRPTEVSRG